MSSLVTSTVGNLVRQVSRTVAYSPYHQAIPVRLVAPSWQIPRRNLFWAWRRRAAEEAAKERMLARRIGRALTVGSVVFSVCGIIGSSIATAVIGSAEEDEDEFLLDNLPMTPQVPRPLLPGPLVWPEEAATPCDRCTDEMADMIVESMSEPGGSSKPGGSGGSASGDANPLVTSVPMPIPTLPGHIQHYHQHEEHERHFNLGEFTNHTAEAVNSSMSKPMDSPTGTATITTVITTTISTSHGSVTPFHATLTPDNCPMRITDAM